MNLLKRAFVFGLMLIAFSGFANAAVIDQFTGDYWYDLIGNSANGGNPGTQVGTMDLSSNSALWNYHASPNGASGSSGFNFTNPSLDENGYLTLQTTTGPMQAVANGNYISILSEVTTTTGPLAHGWMVRKAENPTLTDIAGDYAVFRHAMHGNPNYDTEGVFGTATFSATPNNWSIDTTLLNSSGEFDYDTSGTWTLDSPASTIELDTMGQFKVGAGGLMTNTIVNETNDTLARIMLVKKGTGRTVADMVGRYTLQSFDSSTVGDLSWATWGNLDIFSDGNWTTTTFNSCGAEDIVATGTCTVDDDGTLHILDSEDVEMDGVVNLDGDLLVLSGINPTNGEVGIMFAMRPLEVPEPSSLALLVLGGLSCLVLLRRVKS